MKDLHRLLVLFCTAVFFLVWTMVTYIHIDRMRVSPYPHRLPDRRSFVVFTNMPAGSSLESINAAIAACPSNQVIYLEAGTYLIGELKTMTISETAQIGFRSGRPVLGFPKDDATRPQIAWEP